MRRGLLVLAPLLVVGIAAAVVSVAAHQGDDAFVYEQQHPRRVDAAELEALVVKAREPVAGGEGARAVSARCRAGGPGSQRNPWLCTVRYASRRRITYAIHIAPSGAFRGSDRSGTRTLSGCCVAGGRPSG